MAEESPGRWCFDCALIALALIVLGVFLRGGGERPRGPEEPASSTAGVLPPSAAPEAPRPPRGETRLKILVLDEAGLPERDVALELIDLDDGRRTLTVDESDADGWLRLTVPGPTRVEILGAEGWEVQAPQGPVQVRGEEQELRAHVLWPCRTEFEVLDLDGAPFVGAQVALLSHRGGIRDLHPYVTLDGQGKATRGLGRCEAATLRVRGPKDATPRQTWSVPVELIDGGSLLIELAEVPPPPPRAEVPYRELDIRLDCTDCPSWLTCRAAPDTPGLPPFNELFCQGGPYEWRCECPEAPLSIWGTWLDPLTENGESEPIGLVPAGVGQASLSAPDALASVEGRWSGPPPCGWLLTFGGHWVSYGECDADGRFEITGLRPTTYTFSFGWGAHGEQLRWELELEPGQDLDLGELSP